MSSKKYSPFTKFTGMSVKIWSGLSRASIRIGGVSSFSAIILLIWEELAGFPATSKILLATGLISICSVPSGSPVIAKGIVIFSPVFTAGLARTTVAAPLVMVVNVKSSNPRNPSPAFSLP